MLYLTGSPKRIKALDLKQRTPNQVTETRARVERWLTECEYTTEPIVRDELIWGVGANKENSPGIAVAQMTKYTDRVFLQVAYVLEDGFKDRIALLAPDERASLLWDIRLLLISLDAPFDGIEEPLSLVNFLDTVFIEALNRTVLSEKIFRIHRSYLALAWTLKRKFPDVQIQESASGTGAGFIN